MYQDSILDRYRDCFPLLLPLSPSPTSPHIVQNLEFRVSLNIAEERMENEDFTVTLICSSALILQTLRKHKEKWSRKKKHFLSFTLVSQSKFLSISIA